MVRHLVVRTTAAAAIPVIASYLLGSSLLNLHRCLLLLLLPVPLDTTLGEEGFGP